MRCFLRNQGRFWRVYQGFKAIETLVVSDLVRVHSTGNKDVGAVLVCFERVCRNCIFLRECRLTFKLFEGTEPGTVRFQNIFLMSQVFLGDSSRLNELRPYVTYEKHGHVSKVVNRRLCF